MILIRKEEIMYQDLEAPEIHQLLRRIPENFNIENFIGITVKLYIDYPPSKFLMRKKLNPVLRDMIHRDINRETNISKKQEVPPLLYKLFHERWYRFIGSPITSLLCICLVCWIAYAYYNHHLGLSD